MVEFADYKSIFASKTFWGALIAALGVIIPKAAGFDLNAIWPVLTVIGGAIIAVIGRFTAKKQVTLTGAPPSA
jgi:uncharacterized membrane-anchored protein